MSEATTAFSEKVVDDIHPHDDDPMVITLRCDEWEIKRVLIDQRSYEYLLYYEAFERLRLDPKDLKPSRVCWLDILGNMY